MKFQDDISNMNTYIHTYGQAETNMSPLFQSWGHNDDPGLTLTYFTVRLNWVIYTSEW